MKDLGCLLLFILLLPVIIIFIGPFLVLAVIRGQQQMGPVTLNSRRYGWAGRAGMLMLGAALWLFVWSGLVWLAAPWLAPQWAGSSPIAAILSPTVNPTAAATLTSTPVPPTNTPVPASATPTATTAATHTPPAPITTTTAITAAAEISGTVLITGTAAITATENISPTESATPEPPTASPSPSPTATATPQPTATFSPTPSPTLTFTPTPQPTDTPTFTPTPTATASHTPSPTATASHTPSPTATATNSPTPTATATFTPRPTATNTPLPTATNTLVPTATRTPFATATRRPTTQPSPQASVVFTVTPLPTLTVSERQNAIAAVEAANDLLREAIRDPSSENIGNLEVVWRGRALQTVTQFATDVHNRYAQPFDVQFDYISPPVMGNPIVPGIVGATSRERWRYGGPNSGQQEAFEFIYTLSNQGNQWQIIQYSYRNLALPTPEP